MIIARVAAPAVDALSVSDVKAQLRVTSSAEDAQIATIIEAVLSHVDGLGTLGRAMVTQDWAQWVSQAPGTVTLRMGPFQSLVSVQYYDTDNALQTATLSDFETRLAGDFVTIAPKSGYSWPAAYTRPDAIKITYRAGYGDAAADVPGSIRMAMLMLSSHLYQNREAVTETALTVTPMAVDMLLNNHRVSWYG